MAKKGFLILENGQKFEGDSFGADLPVSGEVVFCTGMTGYPESFTDPSYYGQILVMTYPLIGNYGIPSPTKNESGLSNNFESEKIQIRGLVVSTQTDDINHWNTKTNLSSWLKHNNIPALSGVDTRTLTKIIREFGVAKGIITFKNPDGTVGINFIDINSENLLPFVSCKKVVKYGSGKTKILFIDCGLKDNQIKLFLKYDVTVIRVPWDFNPFYDNKIDFDAVFISNGPGDARLLKETVSTVKEALRRKIPTFGICLGHQILALAGGGDIFKLKYGHRGQNQPVRNESDGKCFITSQNHGYSVIENSMPSSWKVWFTNINDGTNEGICHKKLPFFAVQFHPESNPGPTDTRWLFEYFIKETKKWLKRN